LKFDVLDGKQRLESASDVMALKYKRNAWNCQYEGGWRWWRRLDLTDLKKRILTQTHRLQNTNSWGVWNLSDIIDLFVRNSTGKGYWPGKRHACFYSANSLSGRSLGNRYLHFFLENKIWRGANQSWNM
jgi:hypothetical protein